METIMRESIDSKPIAPILLGVSVCFLTVGVKRPSELAQREGVHEDDAGAAQGGVEEAATGNAYNN